MLEVMVVSIAIAVVTLNISYWVFLKQNAEKQGISQTLGRILSDIDMLKGNVRSDKEVDEKIKKLQDEINVLKLRR